MGSYKRKVAINGRFGRKNVSNMFDTQFSYASAKCAAVESKDLCSPVFGHL